MLFVYILFIGKAVKDVVILLFFDVNSLIIYRLMSLYGNIVSYFRRADLKCHFIYTSGHSFNNYHQYTANL